MSTDGCPEPALLAAYVEEVLDPAARAAIERHVADCPECPAVVGETVAFLRGDGEETDAQPPERSSSQWWWLAAAAALTAILIPVSIWKITTKRDPLRAIKRAAAAAPTRPVEARLAGFAHVKFSPERSEQTESRDLGTRAEAERLAERGGTDVASLHARGVAALLNSDAATALEVLTAAARSDAGNSAIWNDLAAAYLTRNASPGDLSAALAAVNRAISLCPGCAAPHFNRALVLERLGSRSEAREEYQRLLGIERNPSWRTEVKYRVSLLGE